MTTKIVKPEDLDWESFADGNQKWRTKTTNKILELRKVLKDEFDRETIGAIFYCAYQVIQKEYALEEESDTGDIHDSSFGMSACIYQILEDLGHTE